MRGKNAATKEWHSIHLMPSVPADAAQAPQYVQFAVRPPCAAAEG
jgi:hypothetical protein